MEDKHLKIVGVIFIVCLSLGLAFQFLFNEKSLNEQLYISIMISSQLILTIITTCFLIFSKRYKQCLRYTMTFLANSMTLSPIEILILKDDIQNVVWFSYMIGILVIGISICVKNKFIQIISIFFQSNYLMLRVSSIENFVVVDYLIRTIEISFVIAVILYIGQDQGKIFLMNFFVENTKANTAQSVIKNQLPLPIFATKLKTKNLDSSQLLYENLDNLELDIVFANTFCRQIFNIKKKIDMKQKLKYLFLQGDSNHNKNNGIGSNKNLLSPDPIDSDMQIVINDIKQRMLGKSDKSQNQNNHSQYAKLNCNSNTIYNKTFKNDLWNLQRSQIEALSPTKEDNMNPLDRGYDKNDKYEGSQINGKKLHVQPAMHDSKHLDSQSNNFPEPRSEVSPKFPNFIASKALIDGFIQQNQVKKQTMTQQFLKSNFTKQEIQDYGILMSGSQVTNLLYFHILEKLYSSLFNRFRNEPNGEQQTQIKENNETSLRDLSQRASQTYDQQEEIFLDVLYIDSEKKRRKFFDIKIIEVEWENENAMMVIMNDISEKMRIKRMKEIDSFKNDILSTITHNLKTPLNYIILTAQAFQNQLNPKIKDAFSDILQNSQLLLYQINDILDYSRLSQGNIALNLETFSLQTLINEVLSIYKKQTQVKNIKLNYILMGSIQKSCQIINDFNRIKQILINLLGNALKCTFEGQITVIFEITAPNLLLISIKDTGIGMSGETIKSIQKIQMKKKKDMQQGVGIGLLIGKSLLQLVGPDREFRIESQKEQGSMFSFSVYLIHKVSKNTNNGYGIEISHLQNSLLIDKSIYDGGNNQINGKFNFQNGKQKINKINTMFEKSKLIETQEALDKQSDINEYREVISQRNILDDNLQTKNNHSPQRNTTDNNDTQQNFLSIDHINRRNTNEFYEKLKKNPILRKQQISDISVNNQCNNSYFNNTKYNDPMSPEPIIKKKLQQQDQDFSNLLKQNYQTAINQTSMDDFKDEDTDEGNVSKKYQGPNQSINTNSRVRVLSYKNNSTDFINSSQIYPYASKSPSISYKFNNLHDQLFPYLESSPNSITNQQTIDRKYSVNKDMKTSLTDSNQETVNQNMRFNFHFNQQMIDSVYTQNSKEIQHIPDQKSSQSKKSPKNKKALQYSQNSQIQQYNSPSSLNSNTIKLFKSQNNYNDSHQIKNSLQLSKENSCDNKQQQKHDNAYQKQGLTNISESSLMNSQKNITEQATPASTTSYAYMNPISPIKQQKLKYRQLSLNSESNPINNRIIFFQNSSQFQTTNHFKFNSNANLEDSKFLKVSLNNYNQGQGRLYEFIEESRDIDDNNNAQENYFDPYPKIQMMSKIPQNYSSTNITLNQGERGLNLTVIEKNPNVNMKLSSPSVNYQKYIQEYFESSPKNILIVDDTVFNIKALRYILQKYKAINIEEAFNGQQAVQKVKQTTFDIIFMDINMPVMDGFEATKQIRSLQKENIVQNDPIIIIVTAFGDQENKTLSFESGANEHLEKPLTLDSIQQAIYQQIKR